jgi:hypothetical protein
MRGRQRRIIPCLASIVLIALWSSSCFSSKGAQQLSSSHLAATATSYNGHSDQCCRWRRRGREAGQGGKAGVGRVASFLSWHPP